MHDRIADTNTNEFSKLECQKLECLKAKYMKEEYLELECLFHQFLEHILQHRSTDAPLSHTTNKEFQCSEEKHHDVLAESEVRGTRYCLIRYRPIANRSDSNVGGAAPNHAPTDSISTDPISTDQSTLEPLSLVEHHPLLSPRERAIAKLIAQGFPNKIIGDKLGISPWTVATYIRRIFAKIGVTSRSAMIAALVRGSRSTQNPPPHVS